MEEFYPMTDKDFNTISDKIKTARDGTSTILVEDLEKVLSKITGDDEEDQNDRENIQGLIDECKDLWYDDYATDRDTPKADLIKYLKKLPNMEEIITNVKKGKYD